MLGFLFRGLTAEPTSGAALFDRLTTEARQPAWFVNGQIPDTINGRFAVLATVLALTLVRLERDGPAGDALSIALTERFIQVMEAEHRELGISDPTLGKTVRKLVGMFGRRTERWRSATRDDGEWTDATRASLYANDAPPTSIAHCANALRQLAGQLSATTLAQLDEGRVG